MWLLQQANDLFAFFERHIINPLGGFHDLDDEGRPTAPGFGSGGIPTRYLFATSRIVHAFAIAHLMGRPGADFIVDHGMHFLWNGHRDQQFGGYYWGVGYNEPTDSTKQAYGHAFVLLAASSAKVAGHPDAQRLLDDVSTVIRERFWEERFGAAVGRVQLGTGVPTSSYRGQNSNMHLAELLMAAFEATADSTYLHMAERIAELIVRRRAAENNWRLAGAFHPRLAHRQGLFRQPHVSSLRNHARPLAGVDTAAAPVVGARRTQVGLAPELPRNRFLPKLFRTDGTRNLGGFYYSYDWEGRPLSATATGGHAARASEQRRF